jgi:hypothetical protein
MLMKFVPRACALLTLLFVLPSLTGCQAASSPAASSGPDPNNELPTGFVDQPTGGATVGRQMQMYGWAHDDGAVSEIRIFVDGRFVARTTLTQPRPDVTTAFPQYAAGGDMLGWVATVPLTSVSEGTHTVLVQAVDNKGATRDIGSVDVSFAP